MSGFVGMLVRVVERLNLEEFFAEGGEGDGERSVGWRPMGQGAGKESVVVADVWEGIGG